MPDTIKGFKGFDRDFKCRGFQFKEGETYKEDEAVICEKGFHFCENPLDVFGYYPPGTSRFAEVEGSGKIDNHSEDSKISCTEIKIGAEVNLKSIIEGGIKFIFSRVKWSAKRQATGDQAGSQATGYQAGSQATGDQAGSQATGYQAGSQATGYQAGSQATGDYAMSSVNGLESKTSIINKDEIKSSNSVAMGIGIDSMAAAVKGCWIVLAESKKDKKGKWNIVSIKSIQVDGKKIKENVFYKLKNGKFSEVK
jgi:hypothetical protein